MLYFQFFFAKLFLLVACTLFVLAPALASQWHAQIENDATFAQDGNYTNALALGWESAPITDLTLRQQKLPLWFHWQHAFLISQRNSQNSYGIKLNQRMWTPNEIKITSPQPYDRPYAGLLQLESHTSSYKSNYAQKNWFAIGVTGPASGAKQVQKYIHDWRDASKPKGWSYQIEQQLTVQLAYEVDTLLYRQASIANTDWEISGYSHIELGNFRSQADLGLMLRWGSNLANTFGRLSSHYAQLGNITSQVDSSAIIAYTKVQRGYRFNDLSIEGDLPYQSYVKVQHQQAKVALGFIWSLSSFAIDWSFNGYTKDYTSDAKTWHGYGSLSLIWSM
ncbi:lipid A deacylase LpxR family protein [Litorilituus sediminis]|uniref:Lipid A deacylase LpxR family protein n=1 Tax=Litorilituus sediminis TaxID=718192 RepID=A0A4P6P742_9GAMM|nr:lipid A deacylase LpxR family protein [Litorilituus sediminis]QBG37373.1 lipid A deacylase LpxR family protein [Litorilituus sediminis]